MSSTVKFRMHMGCGEPLQSRSWVSRPLQVLLATSKPARVDRLAAGRAAGRCGGPSKS
jgi:hypothetical protein